MPSIMRWVYDELLFYGKARGVPVVLYREGIRVVGCGGSLRFLIVVAGGQ